MTKDNIEIMAIYLTRISRVRGSGVRYIEMKRMIEEHGEDDDFVSISKKLATYMKNNSLKTRENFQVHLDILLDEEIEQLTPFKEATKNVMYFMVTDFCQNIRRFTGYKINDDYEIMIRDDIDTSLETEEDFGWND